MNTYTYTDYRSNVVVFTCQAANILEADKQYEAATGFKITKQPYIGCQIEFNGDNMTILAGDDADFMQSAEEMTKTAAGLNLEVDVYVERLFPDEAKAWKARRDALVASALQLHIKAAEMIAKYAEEIISADMVQGVVDPKEHIRRFKELEECGIPMDDVYKLCQQHGFGWDEESDAVYELEQAQFQPYADKYGIIYTELESSEESWREIGETLKNDGFLAFKGPEYVALHIYRRQIPDDIALIVSKLPIPEEDLAIIATFDL